MIEPFLADDAFLEDVEASRRESSRDTGCDIGRVHLWWLGQSGYLIQWRGRHLLIDPYLSDSLTKKYAGTDKPHVRMTRRVVDPARLDFIDAVTSSHNHTDHLDGETLKALLGANPALTVIVPEANRKLAAERMGIDPSRPIGLDDGVTVDACGFQITGIVAAHEAVERDDAGRCKFLGYVIRCGSWSLYHSGDTVRYEGMAERLLPHHVDLALLPINGAFPERRVPGNLSGVEAARLAKDIGARLVIPCHYDMFAFNTASSAEIVEECERLGQACRVLRCGERFEG